jgi:methionyl-tRNA synthetase
MPETPHKFFLTTPIYYVNARPHIGHAYTTIAADVIARRHRLLGDDTFFLTGTDEHGQKVQRSAAAEGVPPQQFADEVSGAFSGLWKRMGILDDSLSKDDPLLHRDFIRTTDERHKRGVQHLWRQLEANGAIYLSSYTGAYCVSDEAFVDLPAGTPCPDCDRITETITEENYFFRLSDYQLPLLDLIEDGPNGEPPALQIKPETVRNEVLKFVRGNTSIEPSEWPEIWVQDSEGNRLYTDESLKEQTKVRLDSGRFARSNSGTLYQPGALKDLSISRTSFTWGIPVPSSESVIPSERSESRDPRISPEAPQKPTEKHVVYVWLDALANYITALGYGSDSPEDKAKFARYWPADLHLVGKEITRFHCVYWPAFLLAAGLPLPKSIVANGWLLFEESKMSKSRGNVVRTETILDAFGMLCPPKPTLLSSRSEAEGSASPEPPPTPSKADQDLFAADVLRYFLLREIPFGQDGTFSFDALITRYNADLANGYGNLVSRTLNMVNTYFAEQIPIYPYPAPSEPTSLPLSILFEGYAEKNDFFGLLRQIWKFIAVVDGKITSQAPWKLAKSESTDDREKLAASLYTACESIRVITAYLYPILPYATASVWRQLGLGDIEEVARNGELKDLKWGGLKPGTKLGALAPIFPRADKGLAQIMTDMENPVTPTTPGPATTPTSAVTTVAPDAAAATDNLQPATDNSPVITIDDFAKVDLRVAQIVVAERIPKADKLLRLEVDLGPDFPRRQILAGIGEHYAPETLIGRKVVIVANLASRKMRGLESQGMVVAASIGPAGAPVLTGFLEDVELGARLK